MSAADHLGAYAEGWTNGDSDKIVSALSGGFVFDDPNAGKIAKSEFAAYFAGMAELVESLRGADFDGPFMALTEVVTNEADGILLVDGTRHGYPGQRIDQSRRRRRALGADRLLHQAARLNGVARAYRPL